MLNIYKRVTFIYNICDSGFRAIEKYIPAVAYMPQVDCKGAEESLEYRKGYGLKLLPKIEIKERHRKILRFIKNNTKRLIFTGVCSLTIAASTSVFGYLIKPIIDDVFVKGDPVELVVLPLVIAAVFLFRGLGRYGQEYHLNYVSEDTIRQLRNQLYNRIQDLPLAFFQRERTGGLMSIIMNDVNMLKNMVSMAVTGALQDAASIMGLTVIIFYQNWRMAIIAFMILPLAFFPVFELGRRVRRVRTDCQRAMADLNAFLHETFAGNKIVKAFGMEAHEKKHFHNKTDALFKLEIKEVIIRALSSPLMEFFGGVGVAFVIWYGGWEFSKGKTTPGTFMSFLACVILLYEPVKRLSTLNSIVQRGLAATDRIYDILETRIDIKDPPNPHNIPEGAHTVSFDNVEFSYGETPVLKGVDLTIPQGQVLALVGMSGGGKTTIANLIPRFFDVNGGRICIDDIDIREFSVADLRKEIAVVTQEPILFDETVRDNIAYGKPQASDDDIIAAAKAAYAHDFIKKFDMGYDTRIGELGGRLSGGEKQRLCIARALVKDAPILILDEATSSLDSEAEALVQKALENLMRGRTTLVIAHRLSTVANADQIAVVIQGRIAERGTHEALLALNGEYTKLFKMQYSGGARDTLTPDFPER